VPGKVDKTRARNEAGTPRTCRITRLKRIMQTGQDVTAMQTIGAIPLNHPTTGAIRQSAKTR
jgi:hypothetical protein